LVGLIGANGAGKTTLFRCIMGTLGHTGGQVSVEEGESHWNSKEWKQLVGYVGDYRPLFEHWSGARNLRSISAFYENWSEQKTHRIASRLDLDLSRKAGRYSSGERTKLAIICALAHTPRVLLLDEPATGLDSLAREAFHELLQEEVMENSICILYATHHVSEIQRIVDELVFIAEGRIAGYTEKETLENDWRRISFHLEQKSTEIPGQVECWNAYSQHEVITSDRRATLEFLEESGARDVMVTRLSLEEICIQLIKNRASR